MSLIAYKYRLYPNETQKSTLAKVFGCVRFIWNKNVEVFNDKDNQECKSSTQYRHEFEFLKEVSASAIQQKEMDFKEFKKQFFSKGRKKRFGRPSFKSRRNKQSFRLPNQKFTVKDNKIRLEKIGWLSMKVDREFSGRTKSVTVSMDTCGDYYASILVETIVEPKPKTNQAVGLDMGIKEFLTSSDGLQIKMFADNQSERKKIQRKLSRKKKGSKRYRQLKLRLAKLHRKDSRRREWLLHNLSTMLVNNYDVISIEDLNVAGMLKNHKLANAISKQAWSDFFRMLDYKCELYQKSLIKIDRWFPSSKMCSDCGAIKEDLKLSDRTYNCDCGLTIDRDLNASINILSVGVNADSQPMRERKTDNTFVLPAIPVDLVSFL